MIILSIYPWTNTSSAALSINGKIVSASPEERFNRVKGSSDFPINAINWCLKEHKLSWKNIDAVAIAWNPSKNIKSASSRWINNMRWRGEFLSNVPAQIMKMINYESDNHLSIFFDRQKIFFLNHHECHAASAFFASPFKNSDILTIDGHGENETCFMGYGRSNKIIKKNSIPYPHSVGLFYGTFTDYLGFKPDSDEWKTMALSSFSKKKNIYDKKINKIFHLTKNGIELDLSYFNYFFFDAQRNFYNDKFIRLFGKSRRVNDKYEKRHYEIAGAMQRAFEKQVFHLLKLTKNQGSNSGNIVLAGGAAMNCVFNGLLEKNKIYKNNYIPPWPDDLGVSIGAAYLLDYKLRKNKRKIEKIRSSFLGPKYNSNFIENEIRKYKLNYSKPKKLNEYIAKKISYGKLIGWFNGRMEFGQRALGNRSILADPRNKKIKDTINKAIKYRENFRPFAPAVLEEEAYRYFDIKRGTKIEFMEKAVLVKNLWRDKIPGVTHVDGTARVQTVSKKINPDFYDLIYEFRKITKIPILINTSLNLNGEPIVCSPKDAIRTFFSCGLDILVLGRFVIEK